ncbi:MAG: hypothetical protein VCG02_11660, partial [Verrucomicrobiota bacterium]
TYHNGKSGSSAGRSVTRGNTTTDYDKSGRKTGSSRAGTHGTTYHNGKNGSSAGRSVTRGNTTTDYDKSPRKTGSSRSTK